MTEAIKKIVIKLTVDSFREINNKITCSNNIILREVNVKRYEFDKTYTGKELTKN